MTKRYIPCLLSFLLILTVICNIFHPVLAHADASYSVSVGSKLKLKTTLKKATWGSTDKSIASVSKKGVVKGKASGTCLITAVSGGKAEVFSVTVTEKKKSSSSLKVESHIVNQDDYNYSFSEPLLWISNPPSVFIGGHEFVLHQNTLSEIIDAFQGTTFYVAKYDQVFDNESGEYKYCYTPYDESKMNDLSNDSFSLYIAEDGECIGAISFTPGKSYLIKDSIVIRIALNDSAYSNKNTYFFYKEFQT